MTVHVFIFVYCEVVRAWRRVRACVVWTSAGGLVLL